MNRRTFLKSIATACGAVVACPDELLRPVTGIDYNKSVKWIGHRRKLPWKHFQMTCYYNRDKLIKMYQGQYYETT